MAKEYNMQISLVTLAQPGLFSAQEIRRYILPNSPAPGEVQQLMHRKTALAFHMEHDDY